MERRSYDINIIVNNITVNKIIIDSHYKEKHAESITDEIILSLVKTLDGQVFEVDTYEPPYSYFVTDKISFEGKLYKLIWLLEDDQIYIGVINSYRRD